MTVTATTLNWTAETTAYFEVTLQDIDAYTAEVERQAALTVAQVAAEGGYAALAIVLAQTGLLDLTPYAGNGALQFSVAESWRKGVLVSGLALVLGAATDGIVSLKLTPAQTLIIDQAGPVQGIWRLTGVNATTTRTDVLQEGEWWATPRLSI